MKPSSKKIVSAAETAACAVNRFGFEDVAGYRLYSLDEVDKVSSAEWIEAEDDEAAIEAAKTMMDGHDCELWLRSRKVLLIRREPGR